MILLDKRNKGEKSASKLYIGVGYVFLPSGFDNKSRDEFIRKCMASGRISILLEDGYGIAHNCYVSKEVLKNIEFPINFKETGSAVIYITLSKGRQPIIIASLVSDSDDFIINEEAVRVLRGSDTLSNSLSEIYVNGKRGIINISSTSDNDSGGRVNIKVSNKNLKAKLNISVSGDINVKCSNKFETVSYNGFKISNKNIDNNVSISFEFDNDKFSLYNEEENLLTLIEDLFTVIKGIQVPTPSGTSGYPLNILDFDNLLTRFKKLLK